MTVPLFDVQAGFGGAQAGEQPVELSELTAMLDRLAIDRALVCTVPEDMDRDVPRSNEQLFAAAESDPRLVPCPTVVPAAGGDFPREPEQVDELIARGARAACVRPVMDHWSLSPWASSALFEALEARRMPVLCLVPQVGIEDTARLAERYGRLPLVVAGVAYRDHRTLAALLEAFGNVHLSIGSNYTLHGGIEQFVAHVGPERLLFGTGFPAVEPMMAVTQLMYADLSEEHKAMIGAHNLQWLIEGVET